MGWWPSEPPRAQFEQTEGLVEVARLERCVAAVLVGSLEVPIVARLDQQTRRLLEGGLPLVRRDVADADGEHLAEQRSIACQASATAGPRRSEPREALRVSEP